MKILAVSDQVVERVYALSSNGHFQDTELILGCGDMPYEYLEYLVTVLNVPMYYVPGNHDPRFDPRSEKAHAEGGSNLDLKIIRHKTFLIGGFGGSIRYRPDGVNQYTQAEAYLRAFTLLPRLILNRMQYGRALDILISHSPPFGIHDDLDPAHNGLKALNWLIRVAQPRYLFHGHTHFYKRNLASPETTIGITKIMNVYPYKTIEASDLNMSEELNSRVRADFSKARFKSFINQVFAVLSGQPTKLLSYDEVKEKLHIGGPIYRGVKTIRVEQIVGSLNRYHEFDRAFLPKDDQLANRWQKVDRAFYQDIYLPPVVLYKVGEVYFVVDGHHRVSVAREQGQEFIEAEVRECSTRVNITPNIKTEDLEILGAKVNFLERTALDDIRPEANIKLTIPDGFDRMLEHIAVHRYFMGLDMRRDISEQEAVAHWYDKVYMPIVEVIRKSDILKNFPDKTEGDMYMWTLDHQHYLSKEHGKPLQPPHEAARKFVKKDEKKYV